MKKLLLIFTTNQVFYQELTLSEKTNKISYEGAINIEGDAATVYII